MRPILLEIEGFLSYKEKTIIDFSDLTLFAITGVTGAGKTSIIDAITFALYGKCPRFEKGASKEDYISKGKDFFRVALTFSLNNKTYVIERSLKTGKSMNLSFKENGKEIKTEEKNKVREELIQKILDMDYDTFTKIIVLPQGEFAKFIKPDKPKERREIIMKLSNLDKIDKIRELASSKKKDIQDEINTITSRIESLTISYEDIEHLENTLKALEEELENKKLAKDTLQQRLSKAIKKRELNEELEKARKECEILENKKEYMDALKGRIDFLKPQLSLKSDLERYIKLKNDFQDINQELSRKVSHLKDLEKHYQELLEAFKSIKQEYENNKAREERIEKGYNIIRRLESAQSLEEYINKRRLELDKIDKELSSSFSKLTILSENIKQYESVLLKEDSTNIEKTLEELVKSLNQLEIKEQEMYKKLKEKDNLSKEISILENEIKMYSENLKALEQQINSYKNDMILYHSGILRKLLRENDICPVCGSIYHEKEHITLEGLEIRDGILEEFENTKNQISLKEDILKSKKELLDKFLQDIELLRKDISEKEAIEKHVEGLKSKKETLDKTKELLNKAISEKEKLDNLMSYQKTQKESIEKEISYKEQELKSLEQELLSLGLKEELLKNKKNAIIKFQEKIEKLKKEIQEARKQYESQSELLSDIEKKILILQKDISSLENQKENINKELSALETKLSSIKDKENIIKELNSIEKYEREYNEYITKLNHIKEVIDTKEKEIGKIDEDSSLEDLQKEIKTLEESINNLNKEIGSTSFKINQIKENQKEIENLQKTIKELETKQRIYERLEQDLRSDALQAYISQKIIEELIKYANLYASKMDFPYTFRMEEASREKDSIVVEDAFGNIRPINSLSGGETFITSLCFALALGEAVGSYHLQSLFIDEGFGTLDKETLEKVGNALELLSQNINKMVGIITHVESLAEKFTNRIMVIKTKDGTSKIEIV